MSAEIKIALCCFGVISFVSAIITLYDKIAAKKFPKNRISEKTFMILAVFGGALCEYIVMKLIRHKTRHKKFMIGLPVIVTIQAILIIGIIYLRMSI